MKNHPGFVPVLAMALTLNLLPSPSAASPLVVLDPGNLVQNMLTAARALEQINNQTQQLQNEARMLANQGRNLASLDFDTLSRLRAALADSNRLIAEAQGMAYEVSNLDREFARLYPQAYTATISGDRMAEDARERWHNSLEGLRTSMRMQAQANQNLEVDEGLLTDLVGRSQAAIGQLQATQATNQLLALQARQSIQAQQLQITQERATALEQARVVATQERSREIRRRFQGEGTRYTPQAVSFYGAQATWP